MTDTPIDQPPGPDLDPDHEIRLRIAELQHEHRRLDDLLEAKALGGAPDDLLLRRLKKRKLQVKDAIVQFQMRLTPDVPA